jgi:hypothetical protein
VDKIQEHVLSEVSLTPVAALNDYDLAPLSARRDISMMGLIYRISSGLAPPQFSEFIYPPRPGEQGRGWAFNFQRHGKQLHDPIDGTSARIVERSVLGLIYSWNALPSQVVEHKALKVFQRALQRGVKACARSGCPQWPTLLREGARANGIHDFRKWFRD